MNNPELPPPEPSCPPSRRPHKDRIADILKNCPIGKLVGVACDDTHEHRSYYLYHLTADPSIKIDYQGSMGDGIYLIRIIRSAD